MDEQLLREFLTESEDLIEVLFGDLQALRARHREGRARRELVGRIFRHVHTIKGSAAAAGLDAVGELAHEFETLLDAVRMGRVAIDEAVLEAFEASVNSIAAMLNAVAHNESASLPHTLVEQLRRLAFAAAQLPTAIHGDALTSNPALASLPAGTLVSLSDYEQHRLHEAVTEGARLFVVTVDFDLMTFDEQFRNLSDALAEGGEIISTLPGMEASALTSVNFRIVYATDESREEVLERISPFGATLIEERHDEPEDSTQAERAGDAEDAADSDIAGIAATSNRDADTARTPSVHDSLSPAPSASALTMLVRVPLEELDELISATHELSTDTAALLDLALAVDLTSAARTELEIRAPRIRRRFVELEERLIELRMIPVRQTLERATRAGLSAARVAGREVDFEIVGGEVRLDKSLADALADPLLHLLRNAVDHGIELPDERLATEKPARGRIRLEAIAEGSRVILRITDDGRGIDAERIARVAVERGIISPGERMTEQQCFRLIFRPGFSTAREVSTVSGRGVGLDVVEQAVEQAGGELRVWSKRGAGTTFEMRMPTTLALVPSLVVRSAENRYCVDASHIVAAGYVSREETEIIGEAQVVRWRGALIPLVHLRTLLAQPVLPTTGDERIPIIISHVAGRETDGETGEGREESAAVAVDGWDGHSEVLVRSLGRHAPRWRGVSGATALRDGTVALMLDLPRLLEMQM